MHPEQMSAPFHRGHEALTSRSLWRGVAGHYFRIILASHQNNQAPFKNTRMGILRAIGLGIGIIVLKLLMPDVFEGLEDTLIAFFHVLKESLALGSDSLHNTAGIGFPRVPGT